jgi:hypothetical protein
MAACDASLQTLAYDVESSASAWAENVNTFTYAVRLIEPIDVSGITQQMLDPSRVVSVRNDGTKGTPGPWDINFSFSCWWTGRGSTSAGAVTLTDLYRLIGYAIGGSAVAASSGSTLTGGTVNIPTTTASGTFSAGGLCAIGTLGDGDGEGQAYAIATHSVQNLTLLTDMIGAPANGAVLYAPDLAYTAASACQLTGLRFRVGTADAQYRVHGCAVTGMSISQTNPGETPRITFTVRGSWATQMAETFPAASPTAPTANRVVHNASGSCFFNALGTTTNARLALRQLSLNLTLGVAMVEGGLGVDAAQTITGATRTQDTLTVSAMVDALGADATPLYADAFVTNAASHMLITFGGGDGNGIAAYLRNLCYTGDQPTQTALNGRNTIPLSFVAYNGATTTSDLTRAMLVLAGW